jgi:hypothetical protein
LLLTCLICLPPFFCILPVLFSPALTSYLIRVHACTEMCPTPAARSMLKRVLHTLEQAFSIQNGGEWLDEWRDGFFGLVVI